MFCGQTSMKADSFTTLNYSRKMFGSQTTDTHFHKMFMSVTYCLSLYAECFHAECHSELYSDLQFAFCTKELSTKNHSTIELSTKELLY